jgi:hypothetical protein
MELLKHTGWWIIPTLAMGTTSLVLITISLIRVVSRKKLNKFLTNAILYLGLLSLVWALLDWITGFFTFASALTEAPDLSPTLGWFVLKISLIDPISALIILIYSSLAWFLLQRHVSTMPTTIMQGENP